MRSEQPAGCPDYTIHRDYFLGILLFLKVFTTIVPRILGRGHSRFRPSCIILGQLICELKGHSEKRKR